MNREEAKTILLLYRPEAAEPAEAQLAAALALAKQDAELAQWFADHCARQNDLREKFRQISPPAGLKEQIISEHFAAQRRRAQRQNTFLVAAAAVVLAFLILTPLWWLQRRSDDTFAVYETRMVSTALRGYAMDLTGNDPAQIRSYLARSHAPADFILPAALKRLSPTGCSIENWQGAKVSLICFHAGKTSPPQTDLWLFVVDRGAVKNAPGLAAVKFKKINRLTTAVWVDGDKLYLLGMEGDEALVRQYL